MSDKWKDNNIQFPRLLAEIEMAGVLNDKDVLEICDSMNCQPREIKELFDRALIVFDMLKTNICIGPVKEHRKYKGKYYELYMTGETLEVCPTDHAKEYLVFTASQSEEMIKELEEIINELRGI